MQENELQESGPVAAMRDAKFIRTCSIWRALEAVGDTSTILIIEASWVGARRFDQFRTVTGLRQSLLSDRLKRLVNAGILEKRPYSSAPLRHEYHATRKGRDLYWSSLMMLRWERRWTAKGGTCDVRLYHRQCGEEFEPSPTCAACGGGITAFDVDWTAGPGVGLMAARYSRRRRQRDAPAARPSSSALMDEAAQIIGDRWASLVMRSLFTGLRRFDEILADTGMATNILSERLSWLMSKGMIRAHQYCAVPRRYEYRLSRKGVDYYPVLLMLLRWGDTYYAAPEGAPLLLRHKPDGHALDPVVTCSHCAGLVRPEDVRFEIVGARPVKAAAGAKRRA
jgi:DNA-binding HxlR family transcriptional regulator